MSIFDKLLGKKKIDVSKLLYAIAQHGGKGIAQVPYDVLATYLKTHGDDLKFGAGVSECLINLNGERFKVVIDQGFLSGLNLQKGETFVTISKGVDFSGIDKNAIAEVMKDVLSSYIDDKAAAYSVTEQIISIAEGKYMMILWANNQHDVTYESLRSPMLSKFFQQQPPKPDTSIDWFEFNDYLDTMVISIENPKDKLDICHLVAEKIIKQWNLAS